MLQSTAQQIPDDENISLVINNVSPPDPRVQPLVVQRTPTIEEDVIPMTAFEAENQEIFD